MGFLKNDHSNSHRESKPVRNTPWLWSPSPSPSQAIEEHTLAVELVVKPAAVGLIAELPAPESLLSKGIEGAER